MKAEEFIAQVRRRARLGSHEEAESAIRATFETLADRLAGNEAEQLAAQLPRELGRYLESNFTGMSQGYTLEEFFRRVSEREGIAEQEAGFHARIVLGLVSEVVTMGEIADVRAQLPPDLAKLFEVENEGEIPELGRIDSSVVDNEEESPELAGIDPSLVDNEGEILDLVEIDPSLVENEE